MISLLRVLGDNRVAVPTIMQHLVSLHELKLIPGKSAVISLFNVHTDTYVGNLQLAIGLLIEWLYIATWTTVNVELN